MLGLHQVRRDVYLVQVSIDRLEQQQVRYGKIAWLAEEST